MTKLLCSMDSPIPVPHVRLCCGTAIAVPYFGFFDKLP